MCNTWAQVDCSQKLHTLDHPIFTFSGLSESWHDHNGRMCVNHLSEKFRTPNPPGKLLLRVAQLHLSLQCQ